MPCPTRIHWRSPSITISRFRRRPELALSPGNFRPADLRCNMSKGGYLDNDDDLDLGIPSEDW